SCSPTSISYSAKRKSQACRFVRAARRFFAVRSSRTGGSRRPLPPTFAITAILVVLSRVAESERASAGTGKYSAGDARSVPWGTDDALTAPAYRLGQLYLAPFVAKPRRPPRASASRAERLPTVRAES